MANNRNLNEDISLEVAEYLEVEDLPSMSQTCRLWCDVSRQYARFWTNATKAIPFAHYSQLAPLSEQGLDAIRKAAVRTGNSRREWRSAENVQPKSVFRLHENLKRAHFVQGTKWMLVLPLKWDEIPSDQLTVSVKCYDLTTGRLAGSVDMTLDTTVQAFAPSWHTSVAVSSTEIIVGIERYCKWSQYSVYYLQRIRLSQSSETDEITFTAETISAISDMDCSMGLSRDGRFLSLDQGGGGSLFVYKTDGSMVPREFTTESDETRYVSFHGDTLMVMGDKTLNVVGIHLPSLLKDWPEEIDEDNTITLPNSNLGTPEGKHTLIRRELDMLSLYRTAILDSSDQTDGSSTDTSRLEIAYMKEDCCFVLPVMTGPPAQDSVEKSANTLLQNVVVAGAETKVATVPQTARLLRSEGYPCQRTLTWFDEDPNTKVRKHSIHVIGVDKPGAVRSLISPPNFNEMDYATIKWIDEASGLIVMRDERKDVVDAPILVLWV